MLQLPEREDFCRRLRLLDGLLHHLRSGRVQDLERQLLIVRGGAVPVRLEPPTQQLHLVLGRKLLEARSYQLLFLRGWPVPAKRGRSVMHQLRIWKLPVIQPTVLDQLLVMLVGAVLKLRWIELVYCMRGRDLRSV